MVVSEIQWSLERSTPQSWHDMSLVCMDDTSLAWYRARRMPVFAYSSQAKGFFSKAVALGLDHLPERTRTRFLTTRNAALVQRVKDLSARLNASPAAIAVGYITSATPPSVAIIGCSSVAQLRDTLGGADIELSPSQIGFLEKE